MIKIYGKDQCGACASAKALLDGKGIPYEYLNLGSDFTVEEIRQIAPGASSFPQIFWNGNPIGGFDQLRMKIGLIENQSSGPDVLLG